MPLVLELDEEIERDVDGVGDVFFSRLGEPVPLTPSPSAFDLSDPPRNPIAISFSARLLFVATLQGFMVAETPEVIRMAKEIKEKGKGPSVLDSCFLDVKFGKVSVLALSIDSLWLAAVVGCDVRFYSVENIRKKESTFSFHCSIKSGVVKDFKWQKNAGKAFSILSSHGSLQLGYLQAPLKDAMDDVDAVDWSENGAFIAVARKNTLSILSLDLKEQCEMKLLFQSWSDGTDSECSIKVDSINWLRNDSIVIGCVRVYEDGKEESYLVQVIAVGKLEFSKIPSKPVVFSFPDLFEDISDDILAPGCGPYLFASYLKPLGLTLASLKKAIGAHLLLLRWSLDDNRREAVSLEYENEVYTPRIDLQENGADNLILGFFVDQTPSNDKVRVKIEAEFKELYPNCTLWCLTSEGKLILFHIMRTSDLSYMPEPSSSGDNKGLTEITSAALSLKHQSAAMLGLNDNAEVKESEPLQRLERLNSGSGTVLTGKEVHSSANSNTQLYSGQRLNTEKLPVVSSRMQEPGSMLAINAKNCIQDLNSCSSGQTVSTTSPIGNLSSETFATMQVGTRVLGQNVEKDLAGSNGNQGASFGSQSTGKLVFTNNSITKSSSSAVDRSVPGNICGSTLIGSENKLPSSQHGPISDDSLPGGKPFSWKVSSSLPPPSLFTENKSIQSEGAKSFLVKKGSPEPSPAMHKPLPIMPQGSMPGKSLNSMMPPSLNNSRNPRSTWLVEPEPELSKQFYNVKDMAKELDKLLSFIEREGGFRDTCTIFQEGSLLTLEDGLQNLSMMSQVHKNKIEKQLLEIQQLQNKMLQVSTRQVYVEGLVKQASNDRYWDIWKRQKLSPELEVKRQHIFDTYQELTNQLVGLERHFNNLEISKFGENGGVHAGRRTLHANADPSRNPQSVQKMYNTLNSQLAAAEQLSNCLSEQMAMLNLNKPSVRHPTVVKELFESIGLSQEASIFHSPESIKRTSVLASITKGNNKINTSSTSKVLESGTARRRYSLDKNLPKFEPQKTIVKRMVNESAVSAIADKHVGRSGEAFHSQTASYAIDRQKTNETHDSSFPQPSLLKLHSPTYPTSKGIQEKPPKEASEPQLVPPFKWTSGSFESPKSNSHPDQPILSSSPPAFFNSPHGIADGKFQLSDSSSNVATHTASQSGSSSVSKTAPSSTRMSNFLFNASPPTQTSVTFSRSSTPNVKTTLPSELRHEKTSGQLSQRSGKDPPTKLSVKNSDHLWVSEKGLFSRSDESAHSLQAGIQAIGENRIAQVDVLTSHSGSPETSSTIPFNSLAAASTSLLSAKQSSASLTSSHNSASNSPIFPSLSINSSASISSAHLSSSSLVSFGQPSFDTKPINGTNKTIPVPSSGLTPSTPPRLSSSNPFAVQSHESPAPQPYAIPSESAVSQSPPWQANVVKSNSESAPSRASASESLLQPTEINPLSMPAVSQAPTIKVSSGLTEGKPSVIPTSIFSTFPPTSGPPAIQSTTISPLSTIPQEKDEAIDLSSSQEDEMEEEAPNMGNEFLGGLGSFGLGTATPYIPKSNPFGGSFNTEPASAPFSLTTSPGELFRPASFSIPPSKPIELSQQTQSGATSGGFGGGFSGFGQPANIGAGQQALGSVLGAFGQSRQIGADVQGIGFASSGGFGSSGFSGTANSGGGFNSLGAAGGFAHAAAASGGGFAALGSKGGGFAAVASGGSGGFGGANPGGGFTGGGFGAFSSNQGGGFSGFGGNNASGAGGPPAELFTQMRK